MPRTALTTHKSTHDRWRILATNWAFLVRVDEQPTHHMGSSSPRWYSNRRWGFNDLLTVSVKLWSAL